MKPKPIKVLISHSHDEKNLAGAWKELLDGVSLGIIDTWFSSDTAPTGGIPIGVEWRNQLYEMLKGSDFLIAIQTPSSASRPWIMWECGAASGVDKIRGIIPVVIGLGRGDLANPLSSYQVYNGADKQSVLEVVLRLTKEAEINLEGRKHVYDPALDAYLKSVEIHGGRKVLDPLKQAQLWKDRIEYYLECGRDSEVAGFRQQLYAAIGGQRAIEPALHELLSRVLLDQKRYKDAIDEIDHTLSLLGDDIQLLHRKALALLGLGQRASATEILDKILRLDPNLAVNPEIASLEGRIFREQWEATRESTDLERAFNAYNRAYDADRLQYYPGINAGSLALAKGDWAAANNIFANVLKTCRELQLRRNISYWADFSAGEALLGSGLIAEAMKEYQRGWERHPKPGPRQCQSALGGVRRMQAFRKLADADIAPIVTLFEGKD